MRKMLIVALREYQAAVRTKAFLISLLAMPILMGAGMVAPVLLRNQVDTTDKRVAILDYTGELYDAVAAAAGERNETNTTDDSGKRIRPRFVVSRAQVAKDDPERAGLELSERVRSKELLAFVVIGPDVLNPGADPTRAKIAYHSNSPTYDDFQRWVSRPLNSRIKEIRFRRAGLDEEVVQQATQWVGVTNLGLVSLDETGKVTEAAETNEIANILVPLSLLMLLFMIVLVSASPLMQSVLEEKMQRIVEVLLGSIPPFQLMMGKLLGTVGVSLTIGMLYLGGAFVAMHYAGYADLFPTHLIAWFVLYQALAVLMFGSLFVAVGAAVSDLKESQSLMTPVMVIVVAPMFVWLPVVKEPSATFSTVMSLIPPFTPTLMLVRQAVPPGIPLWQPLLGVLLVLLTTVGCVFAAGRIFRVGLLMQGKGANFREMARWVLRG